MNFGVPNSKSGLTKLGAKTDENVYVNTTQNYLLPEYTTGFLLAKEVSMTFTGMDTEASSHII